MKKLLIPLIFLVLLNSIYAQECPPITPGCFCSDGSLCPQETDEQGCLIWLSCPEQNITEDEWLTKIKSLYKDYIDSGMFFIVAIVIFLPIMIGALAGLATGGKGHVSRFVLELILGVLMFLLYPYLVDVLLGVLV